jgi:DNA primase
VVFDFKSGFKGDVISFISEYLQIGKKDVIPTILKEYGLKGEFDNLRVEDYVNKSEELTLPKGLKFFSEEKTGIIRDQAYSYLLNRGIPEENIQEFGYIYEPGTEFDRSIFIPFFENGKIVYFTTRDFTGKNIKRYNNPAKFNSKQFVYNHDKIEDVVFIFEGVMDAISLKGQVGTAMLSADIGKEQCIKILNRAPNTIVFVPDNDEAGEKTLERNINLLMKFKPPSLDLKVLTYKVEGAKDFNESKQNHIFLMKCEKWQSKDIRKTFNLKRKSTII